MITFDSEGQIAVLGTSFDDFLALLASDQPDARGDCWTAAPRLRRWIRRAGVVGHSSATSRLFELTELTRRFWIRWTARLRTAITRLRPTEVIDYRLVLGQRIGNVALGMSRDALDEAWGAPSIPSWGHDESGTTAFYPRLPLVIRLDRSRRVVTGVTLYRGPHRAITADGTDPMFMRASDAVAWLASLGLVASLERSAITVASAGARFSLSTPLGASQAEPWVESIELSQRTA